MQTIIFWAGLQVWK